MVRFTASVEEKDQFFPIDISDELTLLDFKAYLSAESDIDPSDQILTLNSVELKGDDKTLAELGLKDDELIIVKSKKTQSTPQASFQPTANSNASNTSGSNLLEQQAETLRQEILNNPAARRQITTLNPGIERVIDDPTQFRNAVMSTLQQQQNSNFPGGASQEEWLRLQSDPDNPESQRRIMELIEQDQIEENMRNALEFSPESFASVSMLYINCEVNGHAIKAFVDSGAQTTIISTNLAQELNLSRLIDKRFRGEARGVGKTEILGRIHSAPLKIENQFIPCSFTVLDTAVDMLLGLDMLKRHQAIIDLKRNVLVIADVETPFLGEADIPTNLFNPSASIGQQLGGGPLPSSNAQPSSSRPPAASAAARAASARNQTTSNAPTPTTNFDEETINNLVGLGFSRNEVIRALQQTGGNAELAASILFS